MLSSIDLERLIAVKKREIEQEKTMLGLSSATKNTKEIYNGERKQDVKVKFRPRAFSENDVLPNCAARCDEASLIDEQENISPDLERYIRRYLGLPVMLKAGEYSPNNPLIRAERTSGDVLLGLGEYERRRNTLRKMQQKQYKEYLDQQAKKKQEEKEKADRERREREEKERLEEERERMRRERERERDSSTDRRVVRPNESNANLSSTTKVDSAVQVDDSSSPLSVAVQTEDDLFTSSKNILTQAERELSPHTVVEKNDERPLHPASWLRTARVDRTDRTGTMDQANRTDWPDTAENDGPRSEWPDTNRDNKHWKDTSTDMLERTGQNIGTSRAGAWPAARSRGSHSWERADLRKQLRRRSYGDYVPSILDADAIQLRNELAEKEAAERRKFYQQELKNQILEQQRIREERKTREKLLEQAELRRLEQQLRTLQLAHARETDTHTQLDKHVKDYVTEYERKRNILQKEIEEDEKMLQKSVQQHKRSVQTSKSDGPSGYSQYNPDYYRDKPPYSSNIPETSIFSPNYDVDAYLRRNLNPSKESLNSNRLKTDNEMDDGYNQPIPTLRRSMRQFNRNKDLISNNAVNNYKERKLNDLGSNNMLEAPQPRLNIETYMPALSHSMRNHNTTKESPVSNKLEVDSNLNVNNEIVNDLELFKDTLPIPILKHSSINNNVEEPNSNLSNAMQIIDDKWRVPAVQKNILKSVPSEGGKISILTQLGSIRRQLQLEQMKLDKMLINNNKTNV